MNDGKKAKKPHLGRGLEALLGPINLGETAAAVGPAGEREGRFPPDPAVQNGLMNIRIELLRANPYQPRKTWNEEDLAELARSIRTSGILQPIVARRAGDGEYEIISGERRLRAAKLAELTEVPVIVRSATDEEMIELAIIENVQRTDLNPVERAKAYQKYMTSFSVNLTEAAINLGEDRSNLSNYLRLLDLPADLQDMLIDGQLTMGHARALLTLPTDEMRRKLANRALAGRLSVREVERQVRVLLEGAKRSPAEKREKAAHIVDLERRLQTVLGTKVRIEPNRRGQRGRIVIDYYSIDEFERLTESMGLRSED